MSSKRAIRRRSCESKTKYTTEDEATKVMHYLRHKNGYRKCHVYQCQFCGGWHIGRMTSQQITGQIAKRRNHENDS